MYTPWLFEEEARGMLAILRDLGNCTLEDLEGAGLAMRDVRPCWPYKFEPYVEVWHKGDRHGPEFSARLYEDTDGERVDSNSWQLIN